MLGCIKPFRGCVKDAQDDFPDSTAVQEWAAKVLALEGRISASREAVYPRDAIGGSRREG